MFSIIIPSYNNLNYLKLCIQSLKKNSKFKHEIVVHVNDGKDGTLDFVKEENIKFTYTSYNAGICEGVNKASKISTMKYLLYSHEHKFNSCQLPVNLQIPTLHSIKMKTQ